MATIDTSMYNNLQPVKISSPFENAAMLAQIQQGQAQNRLAQMQLKEAERSDSERNALAGIARQYGNTPEYGNRLMEGGFVQQAQAQSKYQSEQAKTARDAEKAQIESHLKKFEVIGQIMGGVQDQASYDAARQQVAGVLGPEAVAKMPPTYDPALIQQKMTEAMTVKEQLEGKWKKLDYDLNTSKFEYQQGNDAANRGVTMRGQDIGANNAAAGRAVTMRGQDMSSSSAAAGRAVTLRGQETRAAKPMPASALKMQQEELDAIGTASSINADLGAIEQQLKGGKLDLGPVSNLAGRLRNKAGLSNESSRNLATFQATLEKLRNDSLRLNKGVQTDGDAQRAWSELLDNINDPKVVEQRLREINKINKRAADIRGMNVDQIRNNYGAAPLDTSSYYKQPSALGGAKLPGGWTVEER